MVVWFRYGACTVGVEDGLVRASDFASLTALFDAAQAVQVEREQLLAVVGQEIEEKRLQAQSQLDAELAMAAAARERGYGDGLAQGLQDAADQWTESALREASTTQRSLTRQTQRLSQIVSLALERIVEHEDRVTLFNRALKSISRLVRNVPMATLHVHPAELGSARQAVAAFAPGDAGRVQIEVKADTALAPGSCLFESDQGVIDAGLKTQLAAIQRALERAAGQMVASDEVSGTTAELVGIETLVAAAGKPPGVSAQNDESDCGPPESVAEHPSERFDAA